MKVKELIELLKEMNPDQDVVRIDNSGGYEKVYDVCTIDLVNNFPKEGESKQLKAIAIS